jgi:hypothetical protein
MGRLGYAEACGMSPAWRRPHAPLNRPHIHSSDGRGSEAALAVSLRRGALPKPVSQRAQRPPPRSAAH